MVKDYENEYAYYELKHDLLYIKFKPNVVIDYLGASMIIADRLKIQASKAYSVICDITNLKRIDASARRQLALDGSLLLNAVALIARNSSTFALASYYVTLNKPGVITRVFTNLEEAEIFLTTIL